MTLGYKLRGSLVALVYVQLNIQCRQQQVAKEKNLVQNTQSTSARIGLISHGTV